MGRSYYCPHCRKMLNPGTKVIFLVENGDDRELMLLSAKLGEYSVVHSRSMNFEEGKIYTFRCPICRSDLTSSLDENLVDILTQTDDEMLIRVSFSRVFGEQATFGEVVGRIDDPAHGEERRTDVEQRHPRQQQEAPQRLVAAVGDGDVGARDRQPPQPGVNSPALPLAVAETGAAGGQAAQAS